MNKKSLIIATRESPLALWQANWVKQRLEDIHKGLSVQLLGITTSADKLLSTPLYKVGGKGLFVKELEEALRKEEADIAVHSMKDVPMILPIGLSVPVLCERFDARDALVANDFHSLDSLPKGAVVGTSSLRRQSQLLSLRPDLKIAFLRGNVNTRLAKLDSGEFSAIILAAAGLKRLGFAERIRAYLTVEEILPAAGQGVLGIECREDDTETKELIAPLNHRDSNACVTAERALCRYLGGGCHVPIAAYAEIKGTEVTLRGLVANPDGTVILRAGETGSVDQVEALGVAAAQKLISQGAQTILNSLTE
ncbi:MAG: hydroxymethylbilane synthase [Gammaproteobacteria bacterium]